MANIHLSWKIDVEHEGLLIRDYLTKVQGLSKRSVTAVKFNGGAILVDGKPVTVRHPLSVNETLQILFPAEQRSERMEAQQLPLDIIYEDDHILVINKQAHMATIPSRDHPQGTIANAILYYYNEQHLPYTIHIVNRLDRDTSGLLIVAKYRYAHYLFSKLQQTGGIKRQYEAVVHGLIPEDNGTITASIGRKLGSIIEREVREDGQTAITHFAVLKRMAGKTQVGLQLETGRTHQIRVHMAHMGHPLLGDQLYGGERSDISRQALHSKTLFFHHPILGQDMTFTAELPCDIAQLIKMC